MDLLTLFVTAVGLSMDAFSVALCKGLTVRRAKVSHGIIVGLYFGAFQAIMPVIGYFLGTGFYAIIKDWDHWIAFILLGILGVRMIKEARVGQCSLPGGFSFKEMVPLAIATSIDALVVGISFAVLRVNIFQSASFIGVCTFALSFLGLYIGFYFGQKSQKWAHLTGGVLLILIGTKVLLEHLGYLG